MKKIKNILTLNLILIMALFAPMTTLSSMAASSTCYGIISVDGDDSDWSNVTSRTGSGVDYWKMAYSEDGQNIYFIYSGTSQSQWDYSYCASSKSFSTNTGFQFYVTTNDGTVVKDSYYRTISQTAAADNTANGSIAGPYYVEFSMPVSTFSGVSSISFAGTTVKLSDVQTLKAPVSEENQEDQEDASVDESSYKGITIDGTFSDWNVVSKVDVKCPNEGHPECVNQVSVVWDGDNFYIYIKEGKGASATGAGTHSNGKFAIISDQGRETDIQLRRDGTIGGAKGATCKHVGRQWEICVPASSLPDFNKCLNFGFYQGQTVISDITNLDGRENEITFDGDITINGDYSDWEDYSYHTIEYANPGSQNDDIDSKAAIYMDDDYVYTYVYTGIHAHLQEAGGEFSSGVVLTFNNVGKEDSNCFKEGAYTIAVTLLDKNGNRVGPISGLRPGTYTFYLTSIKEMPVGNSDCSASYKNEVFGKMSMTIGKDNLDQMEMALDLSLLADAFGCEKSDLKDCSAKFGKIGGEWIHCAGTSTAPFLCVGICLLIVGGVFVYRRKKGMPVVEYSLA